MRKASRTVSARIHKVIGQLEAVETMISKKRDCTEVLAQISAVRAGIEGVAEIVFLRELERLSRKRGDTAEEMKKVTSIFTRTT
jgi:DNA-binding FrmR family transcriptional regulator